MKLFTLTLLSFLATASLFAQDTLANHGFERWVFNPQYNDPEDWSTLNPLSVAVNVITAFKDSTTKHSGSYSVKLITKAIPNTAHIAPGLLTNGQINADGPYGGQAISSRPQFLSGWFRAALGGGDTALLSIYLKSAGVQIGVGEQYIYHTISSWTSFSIPINYTSNSTPDSVQILFFSSTGIEANFKPNSTLWLDDVTYDQIQATGIDETVTALALSVYPNPASHMITLNNSDAQAKTADIYAVDGKIAAHYILGEGTNQLDITSLSAGHYIVSALGNNGSTYRTALVVE